MQKFIGKKHIRFIARSEFLRKLGLAVLSGILLIVIFPSIDVEVLAWVAFIPLFAAIRQESLKNVFWLGWSAGIVHFLGTLYWVTVAMAVYGNLPLIVSAGLLVLMVVYLSLYLGAFCMILRYLEQKTVIPLLISAPVTWVALEYLRTYFFLGFPWNLLGYSQYLTAHVTQFADITGVYGVSFLIVLVNTGLYTLVLSQESRRVKINVVIVTGGCVVICVGYSLMRLVSADVIDQNEVSATLNVAVVQGNIDQGMKWDQQYRQYILNTYIRLSKQTLADQPDLIVWPETAVPFVFQYDPVYRTQLVNAVQEFKTPLLFGGADIAFAPPPRNYNSLNSAFLLSSTGELLSQYDKIHLVPFGEYVPFKKVLFFIDKLVTAIGEVLPGKTYTVMPFDERPFSTVICFEIIFPNLVRKFVDRGAQFLVTITNDAWYGRSAAPYQHFAMATFRAIENRRAVARAANTGISGFIDPYGRVIAQSDIFVEDAFARVIPVQNTVTFYTQLGDIFAQLCCLLAALWIGYAFYKDRYPRTKVRERMTEMKS
jgi:apolipoprotein N-acyltransferase